MLTYYAPLTQVYFVKLDNKRVTSLVSSSLVRNKTRTSDIIHEKYTIWVIYLHIGGGEEGKVFGKLKSEINSYSIIGKNNCTSHILHAYPGGIF